MLLYSVCTILPQHYKDRVKTDSVREEELKQCLVEWESGSYFQKGNPYAITNYINEHLRYNPKMLGNKNQIRGIYTIQIDSYGEVSEAKAMRSCGIPEWNNQVLQIIKACHDGLRQSIIGKVNIATPFGLYLFYSK